MPAEPLTEEEQQEKEELAEDGFITWKRSHFTAFIKGLERHGRDAMDKVVVEVQAAGGQAEPKTEEEVRQYAKIFFDRHTELKGE